MPLKRYHFLLLWSFLPFIAFGHSIETGKYIDKTTGVEIIWKWEKQENIYPSSWYVSPVNGEAIALSDKHEISRSLDAIKKALKKYPSAIITSNLKKIYLLSGMHFYGVPYGGTSSSNTVYIGNQGENNGYTDHYLEQVFHHEFSSILLTNYEKDFPSNEWNGLLPKGMEYGKGGAEAIINKQDSYKNEKQYHEKGFLCQYSTSSQEEDVNTIAENLFISSPDFWSITDKYSILKKKRDLLIAFYSKIDPIFTYEYFLKISKE